MRRTSPSRRSWTRAAYAVLLVSLAVPTPVHAYIDPATGSFLLQLAAAGLLAGMLSIKRVWVRLRALVGNGRAPSAPSSDGVQDAGSLGTSGGDAQDTPSA